MTVDNAINLTFVLLSLGRPALIIVAVAQYIVRRSPFLCRGFWLLLGCPGPGYILSSCLPGLVLPGSETSSEVIGTGSEEPVLPQQNQAEPEEPALSEPQLTVIKLAIMKKPNGDYLFSANQIRDTVGGNAATIKGWVAEVRGAPQQQSNGHLERPAKGW